jgi:hypothetical protein
VQLWNLATRLPIGTALPAPALKQVVNIHFRPGVGTLIVQYTSGRIVEVDTDVGGHWRERACVAAGRDFSAIEWLRHGLGTPPVRLCGDQPMPPTHWESRPPAAF